MEQEKVAKLLSDNLKNIFAFSLSRLYDRSEAEDLTNDIICEVLKCARRLRNDDAFYGFMWRIAENTFKKRIRKNNFQTIEFDESFIGTYWVTPEEEYLKTEELHLLRRELSLLSKQYRETTAWIFTRWFTSTLPNDKNIFFIAACGDFLVRSFPCSSSSQKVTLGSLVRPKTPL